MLVDSSSPVAPIVLTPLRPDIGSDALRLADLALARGDAFDAVAQYTALVPRIPPSAKPYLELQQARAHVKLNELDQAERLFRHALAAEENPVTRPAALELATLLVREQRVRPLDVLDTLEPMVGSHAIDLAVHVMHVASPSQIPGVMAHIAQLEKDAMRLCRYELMAFVLTGIGDLPGWRWCPRSAKASTSTAGSGQLYQLMLLGSDWNQVLHAKPNRAPDDVVRDWLMIARRAASASSWRPTGPAAEVASWVALAATHNASVVATVSRVRLGVGADTRTEITDPLLPAHRAHAERLLADFLVEEAAPGSLGVRRP